MTAILVGCASLAPKPALSAIELSQYTPAQQSIVYVTKTLSQMNWTITACLFGIGAGVFAFMSGNGMGIKLIASSVATICVALVLASAAAWVAVATKWVIILAVIAAGIGLIALAYAIFVKGKALKEIVAGVQKIKTELTPVIGTPTVPPLSTIGAILAEQSPTTQAVVASIKATLVPAETTK
jgi:hypothetical protein